MAHTRDCWMTVPGMVATRPPRSPRCCTTVVEDGGGVGALAEIDEGVHAAYPTATPTATCTSAFSDTVNGQRVTCTWMALTTHGEKQRRL
jgi:hypothetical protein